MQPPPLTKSLVRAMDILKSVASAPDGSDPQTIADQIDVPRPTVYRLLATLEAVGMVERDPRGAWVVGSELIRLGRTTDLSRVLVVRAQPTMERLVAKTGETAMLAVGRGPINVDVISQVDAPNLLGMAQWVGRPVAPHASAAAKVLLADLEPESRAFYTAELPMPRFTAHTITDRAQFARELDTVAQRGYGETIDELENGLSGIVAPVRRDGGPIIAIIGVYGPTARICGAHREGITASVLKAASQLGEDV